MSVDGSSTWTLAPLCNRNFFSSPEAWEDQVLYSLMLDRFSDGRQTGYIDNDGRRVTGGSTPTFQQTDAGRAEDDVDRWSEAGGRFVDGTLKGVASKIGLSLAITHPAGHDTLLDSRVKPNTRFRAFARISYDVAGRRFGLTSAERQAVRDGWAAVGISV